MSYTRQVTIWCDRCGNWEQLGGTSVVQARRKLKQRGWKRQGCRDLCPTCVQKEQEER